MKKFSVRILTTSGAILEVKKIEADNNIKALAIAVKTLKDMGYGNTLPKSPYKFSKVIEDVT